jgi:mRNA interferase MazF
MVEEGQIVLFRFPHANRSGGKLRPALVIRKLPGPHEDWLICMISSQLSQQVPYFDEVVLADGPDFRPSGLKQSSVIRTTRLAVVHKTSLLGTIGDVSTERLERIRGKLSDWLLGK